MTEPEAELEGGETRCENCGVTLAGGYCHACGQKVFDHRRPIRSLLGELRSQVFAFDSRIWRTLVHLLLHPGFLTREYNAGRRLTHVPPVRLYLLVGAFFFVVLQLANPKLVTFQGTSPAERATEAEVGAGSPLTPVEEAPARPDPPEAPLPDPRQEAEPEVDREDDEKDDREEDEGGFSIFDLIQRRIEAIEARYTNPEAELNRLVGRRIPQTMFFLVPMLALILNILYLRRKTYYVEHLVHAVHLHAFTFLVGMLSIVLGYLLSLGPLAFLEPAAALAALAAVALYLVLSLRRVYSQGLLLTLVKSVVLVVAYAFLLSLALLVVLLVTVLMI